MVANCFSSGSATADAMVSGLAPGRPACTWMVGKSTVGRSLTGSSWYDITPNTVMPSMMSVVVIGRLDEERGEVHDVGFAASAPLTLMRLPGTSRRWPSVTTVSPGARPSLITVSLPAARATSTGRSSTV